MTKFTQAFNRGCTILGHSDRDLSVLLDVSTHTIRRWKSGAVVPPVANMVLRFLKEEIDNVQVSIDKPV